MFIPITFKLIATWLINYTAEYVRIFSLGTREWWHCTHNLDKLYQITYTRMHVDDVVHNSVRLKTDWTDYSWGYIICHPITSLGSEILRTRTTKRWTRFNILAFNNIIVLINLTYKMARITLISSLKKE